MANAQSVSGPRLPFFLAVTLAAYSPELMHLGPPATSSSKVAETTEFQHCEFKLC